jgi:hypothetical protein
MKIHSADFELLHTARYCEANRGDFATLKFIQPRKKDRVVMEADCTSPPLKKFDIRPYPESFHCLFIYDFFSNIILSPASVSPKCFYFITFIKEMLH